MMKLICLLGHCECDSHTVHKLSQRHLTADWLAPQESDCLRMHSKASSEWLPSHIKAMRPFLEILKMAGYFPDIPCICWRLSFIHDCMFHVCLLTGSSVPLPGETSLCLVWHIGCAVLAVCCLFAGCFISRYVAEDNEGQSSGVSEQLCACYTTREKYVICFCLFPSVFLVSISETLSYYNVYLCFVTWLCSINQSIVPSFRFRT
jgi:hypothetical protein